MERLDFSSQLNDLTREFIGREWLFKEVDEFLGQEQQKFLVITGEPGIGKSAVAAQLIYRHHLFAYHLCMARQIETLRPRRFITNLSVALSHHIPGYGEEVLKLADQIPDRSIEVIFRPRTRSAATNIAHRVVEHRTLTVSILFF